MEKITKCPICNGSDFSIHLELEDHFLSKEKFNIDKCSNCGFLLTNPRPEKDQLYNYYKSNEYISHTNNKKGFFNRIYQIVRNYTLSKKYKLISNYKSGESILDIGCATGEFLSVFKKNNWLTKGIEPDIKARNLAKENHGLEVFDETELDKIDETSIDVITMWHVLEHVPDINHRLLQLKNIIKKDGTIFIAVPNPESWDAQKYNKYWAAYDAPRHLYHFSQKAIKELAAKHSFKIIDTIPMKFDSYYVSLLSEKYQANSMRMFRAIISGFKSNRLAKKNNKNYSSLIYVLVNSVN